MCWMVPIEELFHLIFSIRCQRILMLGPSMSHCGYDLRAKSGRPSGRVRGGVAFREIRSSADCNRTTANYTYRCLIIPRRFRKLKTAAPSKVYSATASSPSPKKMKKTIE